MSQAGEALIDAVIDSSRHAKGRRLEHFMEWLKRVSRPPLGLRLISDDGGRFTGIVVVDENKPLAMLALRVGGPSERHETQKGLQERRFTAGPLWHEDDDIYP